MSNMIKSAGCPVLWETFGYTGSPYLPFDYIEVDSNLIIYKDENDDTLIKIAKLNKQRKIIECHTVPKVWFTERSWSFSEINMSDFGNDPTFTRWLSRELFDTNWSAVPLRERCENLPEMGGYIRLCDEDTYTVLVYGDMCIDHTPRVHFYVVAYDLGSDILSLHLDLAVVNQICTDIPELDDFF